MSGSTTYCWVPLAAAGWFSGTAAASGREEVLAVLVIDNSMSMGVREADPNRAGDRDRPDNDKLRLDLAKEAALRVLDQLAALRSRQGHHLLQPGHGHRPAQHRQRPGGPRSWIRAIELTHLATDLRPGIVAAAALLDEEKTRSRELYVFSDMQKLGWQDQDGTLSKTLRDLHEKAQVNLVRPCGSKKPRNAAIVAVVPQTGIARPKERVSFAVMVRNTGSEVLRNLTVTLENDQQPRAIEDHRPGADKGRAAGQSGQDAGRQPGFADHRSPGPR